MGLTYANSFLNYGVTAPEELTLVEKSEARQAELLNQQIGQILPGITPEISESEIIVLAVKHHDFSSTAFYLKDVLSKENFMLSILAAITIARLANAWEKNGMV